MVHRRVEIEKQDYRKESTRKEIAKFTYKALGMGSCSGVDYALKECNMLFGRG